MNLIIFKTLKNAVIATVELQVNTPVEYMQFMRKFNMDVLYQYAAHIIATEKSLTISVPLETDFALDV